MEALVIDQKAVCVNTRTAGTHTDTHTTYRHTHTYHIQDTHTHRHSHPTHTLITHVVGHCFCNNMASACGYLVRVEASCSRSPAPHCWPFYLDRGSGAAPSVAGSYSKPLSCFLVYAHEAVSISFADSKAGFQI